MEEYALRLLAENQLPHFVPMEIRRMNGEVSCHLDTEGMVSLEEAGRERPLRFSTVRRLLCAIRDQQEVLEEYLLDRRALSLDPALIFFGGGEEESVYFCFRPDPDEETVWDMTALTAFLQEHTDPADPDIRRVYEIHRRCRSGLYRMEDLARMAEREDAPEDEELEELLPAAAFRVTEEEKLNLKIRDLAGILLPVLVVLAEAVLYFAGFLEGRPVLLQAGFYLCVTAAAVLTGRLLSMRGGPEPEMSGKPGPAGAAKAPGKDGIDETVSGFDFSDFMEL